MFVEHSRVLLARRLAFERLAAHATLDACDSVMVVVSAHKTAPASSDRPLTLASCSESCQSVHLNSRLSRSLPHSIAMDHRRQERVLPCLGCGSCGIGCRRGGLRWSRRRLVGGGPFLGSFGLRSRPTITGWTGNRGREVYRGPAHGQHSPLDGEWRVGNEPAIDPADR